MVLLVAIAVVIGSCTGEEKRPPTTGSACQGSSCKTDSEQASADANRVEQLTTTINTLKQAITNNRQLSAAEIDELQQQLEAKNTELQTVGDQSDKVVELQQTVDGLEGQLTAREKEIETLNAAHQEEITTLKTRLSELGSTIDNLNAQSEEDSTELANLQNKLTIATHQITELEQKGADVSLLKTKIATLRQQLAQQASTDSTPPDDGDSEPEAPPAQSPPEYFTVCEEKLCAYAEFSKNKGMHYYTEGWVVVEKGTKAGSLTINRGTVSHRDENKFVLDIVVHATEGNEKTCYHAEMKRSFFSPSNEKSWSVRLAPTGEAELCRK